MRLALLLPAFAATILAACSPHGGDHQDTMDRGGVPLPKGWPRTELYDTIYRPLDARSDLFVNAQASTSLLRRGWVDIAYPAYRATLFITDTLCASAKGADAVAANRLERISLNINGLPTEKGTCDTPSGYRLLTFTTPTGSLTPLQFIARKGERVVSGTLAVGSLPVSADSIAPTLEAVERDVAYMINHLK
ncbi:MAG: hypothetical protein NC342_07605 [Pseudoflavonifractor sp.]|nr:hypothetical protein [Alloprevotella sp.]MCM1117385.1 hypothetical protein [Pseudoflavonifractor sp.]